MIKKINILTILLFVSSLVFSQTGTITPSIDGIFIQGISPVNNTFTVTNYPAETEYVDFYLLDKNNNEIEYVEGVYSDNSFSATFDMGGHCLIHTYM